MSVKKTANASFFDVAIVGGGPGGSATALSLRAFAPSLSVVLLEATNYHACRVGESLPPPARGILEHLNVWPAFERHPHQEAHRTISAWGGAALQQNDFFLMPANVGWHVDRAAFDAMLANEAERRGTSLVLNTRVRKAQPDDEGWQLKLTGSRTIGARVVVDATGSATLARGFGARFAEADTLVGIAGFFDGCHGDASTLVEPFDKGWWYTAGLPDDRRIVVCMTDSDIARQERLHERQQWLDALRRMRNISPLVRESRVPNSITVRSASSRRLLPVTGDGWLAVGDSASRFDPLSSQGIVKSLRSGIFASYAIGDLLERADPNGLQKYRYFIDEEFKSYSEARAKYYREEQRWPASDFWRRRHYEVPRAVVRGPGRIQPKINADYADNKKQHSYP